MRCNTETVGNTSRRENPVATAMAFNRQSAEVYLAGSDLVIVGSTQIDFVKREARAGSRGRARLCCHKSADASLHEMLIALTKGTYIRPHRHPDKSESFHVIEGAADIVIFEDDGRVGSVIAMGEHSSGLPFYYRIAAPRYHALLVRSDMFVFHETTNGPFLREKTEFARWSPDESDFIAVPEYMATLAETIRHLK